MNFRFLVNDVKSKVRMKNYKVKVENTSVGVELCNVNLLA